MEIVRFVYNCFYMYYFCKNFGMLAQILESYRNSRPEVFCLAESLF